MRSSTITVPSDAIERKKLYVEADFYQIEAILEELSRKRDFIHITEMTHYWQEGWKINYSCVNVEITGTQAAFDLLPDNLIHLTDTTAWQRHHKKDGNLTYVAKMNDDDPQPNFVFDAALNIECYLDGQIGWKCVKNELNSSGNDDGTFLIKEHKWQKF